MCVLKGLSKGLWNTGGGGQDGAGRTNEDCWVRGQSGLRCVNLGKPAHLQTGGGKLKRDSRAKDIHVISSSESRDWVHGCWLLELMEDSASLNRAQSLINQRQESI